MHENSFFRIDDLSEPYNALKMTEYFISQVDSEEYHLKWAIIAIHNSLQGFMVLALRGTSNLQIIKKNKTNKGKNAYEILSNPENKLDNFLNLFQKIQNDKFMKQNISSNTLICNEEMKQSIEWLNETRNNLIHYLLSGYSIEINSICFSLLNCLKIISFLVNESNNFNYRYETKDIKDINNLISKIEQKLLAFCSS